MPLTLDDRQMDALTEIMNISSGQAARALSELVGERVELQVPRVRVTTLDGVLSLLREALPEQVASVHQILSGPFTGNAMFVLGQPAAVALSNAVTGDAAQEPDGDALMEIGNIVLNASVGAFSNMVKANVSFSMPSIHIESLGALVTSVQIGEEELREMLVARLSYRVTGGGLQGNLVLVLGIPSIEKLLEAAREMETGAPS